MKISSFFTDILGANQTATAAVRIFELLDEQVSIASPGTPPQPSQTPPQPSPKKGGDDHTVDQQVAFEWKGEIDYRGVNFLYPTSKAKTLADINLHVPAGSSLYKGKRRIPAPLLIRRHCDKCSLSQIAEETGSG